MQSSRAPHAPHVLLSVAMLAAMSGTAMGQTWAVNGPNLYSLGKVGVGTVNPFYGKLESRSAGTTDAVISIYGINAGTTGQTRGMYGEVISPDGIGFAGINNATTGTAKAMYGESHGDAGIGGYFIANSATGTPRGVYGEANNATAGIGVFGIGAAAGVQGQSATPGVGYAGVFQGNTFTNGSVFIQNGNLGVGTLTPQSQVEIGTTSTPGDRYLQVSTSGGNLYRAGIKLRHFDNANGFTLVSNESPTGGEGFHIIDENTGGGLARTQFFIANDSGSVGIGTTTPAAFFHVKGTGNFDGRFEGVDESTVTLKLLETVSPQTDYGGLVRYDGNNNVFRLGTLVAGAETIALNISRGSSNVAIVGAISKGSGTFKIDHPLDPENKYLYHSFVESPDMMNVYNGNIVTDERGYATITLPAYFEALNKDFRYQLTAIEDSDSNQWVWAKVVQKIANNEFTIRTSIPNAEVSWQVTGVRKDAFANANRVVPEVEKEPEYKGLYQHPEVFGQPPEKGIFGPHPVNPALLTDLQGKSAE